MKRKLMLIGSCKKHIFLQQFSEILHSAHSGNLDSASGCRFSLYFRMIFLKYAKRYIRTTDNTIGLASGFGIQILLQNRAET